jgi:hypothetical protein
VTLPALAAALAFNAAGGGLSGLGSTDLLDVPFLSQGRLLCGGAAVAMVERFHGRRGVYSQDFTHLLRPDEGGIRTDELAAEVERRGFRSAVSEHDRTAWRRALERGLPPILLIESGRDRYHYVVLVGVSGDTAFVHDPLVGPARALSFDRLDAAHGPARYWTLVVERDPSPPPPAHGDPGDSRSVPDTPWLEALAPAMDALRSGQHALAERRALVAMPDLPEGEARSLAWRLVGTARHRADRPVAALDAWNEAGEPLVDLVQIEGLRALRWTPLEARLPFRPRELLTADGHALAQRRIESAPGVAAARVTYRPLIDGTAEVTAFIAEEPRWPGRLALVGTGADALFDHEAGATVGPLLTGAERWSLAGRWLDADRSAHLTLSAPAGLLPGIATAGLSWRRQRFAAGPALPAVEETRTLGALTLGEWINTVSYAEGRIGLDRWSTLGRRAYLGATIHRRLAHDRVALELDTEAWPGSPSFGRSRVRAHAVRPAGTREWRARVAGTAVYGTNPARSLWDGAGVGRVREPLLRSRRLVTDGAIGGPAFGPRLVQGSLEHAFTRAVGPARAALVLFADAARAWGNPDDQGNGGGWQGAWGLQLELDAERRRLALSVGTGSGDWVVSLRVGGVSLTPPPTVAGAELSPG